MKSYEALEKEAVSVRRAIADMLFAAGSGHPGGSLSCVEILVDIYNRIESGSKGPGDGPMGRDRVVLSKGHAAPALYAVLAEHGFFSKDEFKRLRKLGGILQGHPDRNKTPGVDVCTGSLGIGASLACGLAMAAKAQGQSFHTYAILGDGELQEGIVWEAFMASVHYELDHLVFIVDRNGLQIDGPTEQVMKLGDVKAKAAAFGFDAVEADGHDFHSLDEAFRAVWSREDKRPKCIVARTVKGKGIPFMENQAGWHGKKIDCQEYEMAVNVLEGGV